MTAPPKAIAAALKLADAEGWSLITRRTVTAMVTAAAPLLRAEGAAAERDRIRQLADSRHATCECACNRADCPHEYHRAPFAGLLRGEP